MRTSFLFSLLLLSGCGTGGHEVLAGDESNGRDTNDTDDKIVQDCGPFLVNEEWGDSYEVERYLEFTLNPESPSGVIGSGLQTVIIVDATALCGDVILEKVLFQTTTDGDDIEWMSHVSSVVSAVLYEYEGIPVAHTYGPGSADFPDSSVTGLYWDHEFAQRILIKKGETFTFSLAVTYGDPVVPPGTFEFNLYSRYSWYGSDDPTTYPVQMSNESVEGYELSYTP